MFVRSGVKLKKLFETILDSEFLGKMQYTVYGIVQRGPT